MPAAFQGWQKQGSFGMRILRAETLVRDVDPNSPAAAAGVVAGDRVDVGKLSVDGHLILMNPRLGDTLTLTVLHAGAPRALTLTAEAVRTPATLRWLILAGFVSAGAFIVVGTILVFLRPAPMTWWLWLYCVGILPVNELLDYYAFLPNPIFGPVWLLGRIFLGGFSVFPLLPFALLFPHDRIAGWRAKARVPVAALAVIAFAYYVSIAWRGLRHGLDHYSLLNGLPALSLYLVAGILIGATYVNAHGADRQRLKWAVTGMLVAFVAQIAEYVPGPVWLPPLGESISIVMPVTVAYAALRHHLIDVQFVISRAILYGSLTAILVSFVSLVDWFTSRFISEYHLALYLEATATIGMGFALDRLHNRLEWLTERVVFRARHEAEQHLVRVARSLAFAKHKESIEEALVNEPSRWLQLASAAVFYRDDGRDAYVRGHSKGWTDRDLDQFPGDAPVVRYIVTEQGVLRAKDAGWDVRGLPSGTAAPVLYVPIFSRQEVLAIAIYGAHVNSTTLDPDEVGLLAQLAPGAGIALDHLAFEILQEKLARAEAALRTSQQ